MVGISVVLTRGVLAARKPRGCAGSKSVRKGVSVMRR